MAGIHGLLLLLLLLQPLPPIRTAAGAAIISRFMISYKQISLLLQRSPVVLHCHTNRVKQCGHVVVVNPHTVLVIR